MTIIQFFRLLNRNINILLLSSLALSILVFLFTRNQPQSYQSRTEIYTGIASGMSVEAFGASGNFFSPNNEFDNLLNVMKSQQTLGEVGERLLSQHMMLEGPEFGIIEKDAWEKYKALMPQEVRDSLLVPGSELLTLRNIKELKKKHFNTYLVKSLFENEESPYSYKAIEKIVVNRIGNSDLIEVKYTWYDPGICQNTLLILNEIFTQELLEIKVGQSNDVIEYFQEKVEEAQEALLIAEDKLATFRIEHKIINYDQQTRNIAGMQSSLEQQYQEERRNNAAYRATVEQLENKMELNKRMLEFNDDLLDKRKQLVDINQKIAELEIYYKDEEELKKLRTQAARLEAELSNSMSTRYQYSKTKEGVSSEDILQQWLSATLALDASNARLAILSGRNNYFQETYNEISPLGAELKRLERAADVAEKKYLELHTSLNLALTRQQSESISSGGLVITVPPKYPTEPLKSKILLLVLVAAVIGFLIPLGLVLIIEFLDNTIKTPLRGEELTGLKLIGAYPDFVPTPEHKNVDMDWLREKALGQMTQNVRLEIKHLEGFGATTKRILVFSTRKREGKALTTHLIANKLVAMDKKVLVLSFKEYSFEESMEYQMVKYEMNKEFLQAKNLADIVPKSIVISNFDFVFVEMEAVLTEQYPIELMENFDMSICVVSAQRGWNKADRFALNEFSHNLKSKPRLLLNAVDPDYMDMVLGEISKTRSALRKFLKGFLTLQFNSRKLDTKN